MPSVDGLRNLFGRRRSSAPTWGNNSTEDLLGPHGNSSGASTPHVTFSLHDNSTAPLFTHPPTLTSISNTAPQYSGPPYYTSQGAPSTIPPASTSNGPNRPRPYTAAPRTLYPFSNVSHPPGTETHDPFSPNNSSAPNWTPAHGAAGATRTASQVRPNTTQGAKSAPTTTGGDWTQDEYSAYLNRMLGTRPAEPVPEAECDTICETMNEWFNLDDHRKLSDADLARSLEALVDGTATEERQEFVGPALFFLAKLPESLVSLDTEHMQMVNTAVAHLQSYTARQQQVMREYQQDTEWAESTASRLQRGERFELRRPDHRRDTMLAELVDSSPSYYKKRLENSLKARGLQLEEDTTWPQR